MLKKTLRVFICNEFKDFLSLDIFNNHAWQYWSWASNINFIVLLNSYLLVIKNKILLILFLVYIRNLFLFWKQTLKACIMIFNLLRWMILIYEISVIIFLHTWIKQLIASFCFLLVRIWKVIQNVLRFFFIILQYFLF